MSTILEYFNVTVLAVVATFVATLVFSTKIKDFFAGVPADLRSDLTSIETSVKADVSSYQKTLVAKIAPTPAPLVKAAVVSAPSGPTGPVAPAA
jgi:hypothetical protein